MLEFLSTRSKVLMGTNIAIGIAYGIASIAEDDEEEDIDEDIPTPYVPPEEVLKEKFTPAEPRWEVDNIIGEDGVKYPLDPKTGKAIKN